jgi:3-methyladenine DNA glycosylase/8-oxoguanine DNA glycosylase
MNAPDQQATQSTTPNRIEVRLSYSPPFEWPVMLAFFRFRAIAGIEHVPADAYVRSVKIGNTHGMLEVRHAPGADELIAAIETEAVDDSDSLIPRLRRTFDLDADLMAIAAHLSRDPFLAPFVASRPALRVPAHWEPFETAIRAILGQQVSLVAARRLNTRLVERAGPVIGDSSGERPHRLFPTPQQVLDADLSEMGMPGARVRTMQAVAEAFMADPELFRRSKTVEETVDRLCAIKGIGPWTAQYIAIRACREPDGFPASDAGLLRGTADSNGVRPTPIELTARAEAWRPFRAYAAHHIWAEDEANVIFKT